MPHVKLVGDGNRAICFWMHLQQHSSSGHFLLEWSSTFCALAHVAEHSACGFLSDEPKPEDAFRLLLLCCCGVLDHRAYQSQSKIIPLEIGVLFISGPQHQLFHLKKKNLLVLVTINIPYIAQPLTLTWSFKVYV